MKEKTRQKFLVVRGTVEAVAFIFAARFLADFISEKLPDLEGLIKGGILPLVVGIGGGLLFMRRFRQAQGLPWNKKP